MNIQISGGKSKILLIIIFITIIFFLLIFRAISTGGKNTIPQNSNQPNQEQDAKIIAKGIIFDKYNFSVMSSDNDLLVAIFDPILPRNDIVIIGAMLEVINNVYGEHKIENLSPQIVQKNSINLIMFEGVDENYYFNLIKNDTGEVHSMVFWYDSK